MLPTEQLENIKKQLISQLENANLPDKENIKSSITKMNPEQLEQFLIQNKLIKPGENIQQTRQCIFCSIVSESIKSYKIDENSDAIAILEINPVSKGHVIIIPKEHISSSDKIPKTAFNLAKSIAKKIKTKFKPKDVAISSMSLFGHEIINVLPVYKEETLESEKKQAKPEELEKLRKILEKKPKKEVIKKLKIEKIDKEQKLWLPRRIP